MMKDAIKSETSIAFDESELNKIEAATRLSLARALKFCAVPLVILNIVFALIGPFQYPQVFSLLGKITATSSHVILCTSMAVLIFKIVDRRRDRKPDSDLVRWLFGLMLLNSTIYGHSGFYIFDPTIPEQVVPFLSGIVITCALSGIGLLFIRGLPIAAIVPAIIFVVARILLEPGMPSLPFAMFLVVFAVILLFLSHGAFFIVRGYFTLAAEQQVLSKRLEHQNRLLELARQNARNASASKSKFLASIGHDLRQPIQAARLALNENEDSNDILTRALASLSETANDLIDAGFVSDPERFSEEQSVECNEIFMSLLERIDAIAQSQGKRIRIVPSNVTVRTDPAVIVRVLHNFVSNALKFTRYSDVLVGARRRGQFVRFEVWDQGDGLNETEQSEIFEEFVKLEKAHSMKGGLGLGLSLAKSLAEDLGSDIGVRSVEGKGSVFFIEVMRADSPSHSEKIISNVDLLIVDDSDHDRRETARLARRYFLEVKTFSNLEDLKLTLAAPSVRPAFILTDYQLSNGNTALDVQLLAADTPMAVMTSLPLERLPEALEENSLGAFQKPLSGAAFRAIASALGE